MTEPNPRAKTAIRTADGKEVGPGDRVFDYYDGHWGAVGEPDEQGWFDHHRDEGGRGYLNGDRVTTQIPPGNPYYESHGAGATASRSLAVDYTSALTVAEILDGLSPEEYHKKYRDRKFEDGWHPNPHTHPEWAHDKTLQREFADDQYEDKFTQAAYQAPTEDEPNYDSEKDQCPGCQGPITYEPGDSAKPPITVFFRCPNGNCEYGKLSEEDEEKVRQYKAASVRHEAASIRTAAWVVVDTATNTILDGPYSDRTAANLALSRASQGSAGFLSDSLVVQEAPDQRSGFPIAPWSA